jgi:ATP adenylyltransferase
VSDGPELVEQQGVGVQDAFQRLWTPHRMAYIKGQDKPDGDSGTGCPFCRIPSLDDKTGLIVARGETVYAVLNLYPYNPGHLMVVPYRQVAEFTQHAMKVIRAVSGAHGFNIGLNQGVIAGAGIAAHLHQHLVPRWGGDANFMPIIGQTKVLPQLLGETRDLLADAW